ncbi:hypothetical protein REJC140_00069 [Pseudorhizobium endolithicum]|uniref:DUF1127 domain-containing protein n=1 Tax=Pseudorhizobium endolithicum TaxID=1191678 RepID=A0ABM8PCB0_9HYPH|nr:hypothetical protein [Pseudorhizobium endolithicum]CAD7023027.1 hypothetical protein REJC140_00069 [Pseudorhizobium endolithicum]
MASTSASTHHVSGWGLRSVTRPLIRLASRVQTEWRHRQTERLLESLPSDIRKDIGWPATDGSHETRIH